MAEVSISNLREGENYLYQRNQGPKKEATIVNLENPAGTTTYYVQFKYPGKDTIFDVQTQNGNKINSTHHFYELPEETPKDVDNTSALNTTSDDPTEAGRRRRRRSMKRKTHRRSRTRKTKSRY